MKREEFKLVVQSCKHVKGYIKEIAIILLMVVIGVVLGVIQPLL